MDYPAAHSMDTMWFAVDADGHVAAFDTGEGGGVPEIAFVEDYGEVLDVLHAMPASEALVDPAGHARAAATPHFVPGAHETNVIAFVDDVEPVADLVERLRGKVLRATTGVAIELVVGDRAAFAELHARGACRSCAADYGREQGEIAGHGVYYYACEDQGTPYLRLGVPDKPLALADLPPVVLASAIKFDGRFADSTQVQPAEHWKTQGWGATWVATDGKTVRPFPGREDDLDDEIAHLGADYVVVREPLDRPDGELASGPQPARPAPVYEDLGDKSIVTKKPWWKFW